MAADRALEAGVSFSYVLAVTGDPSNARRYIARRTGGTVTEQNATHVRPRARGHPSTGFTAHRVDCPGDVSAELTAWHNDPQAKHCLVWWEASSVELALDGPENSPMPTGYDKP